MTAVMPRPSRLKLPPLDLGDEDIGHRLARLRKQAGYTQVQLAKKMGITQTLVSAYECGNLRLNADMLARFAQTLNVSADMLLGLKTNDDKNQNMFSLKLVRRMQRIEALPTAQQKVLLSTIDNFLRGAER